MKEKIEKLYAEAVYEDLAPNVFAQQIMQLFNFNRQLPDFLYEDNGQIKIGYHGDTVVTDEWNKWKEINLH